jgi:hypothetical protein
MASTRKPRRAPALAQSRAKSPARPAAEAEIVADDQVPDAQRAEQDTFDEFLGSSGRRSRR